MNLVLARDAVTIFLGIMMEATPFILLGVLASNVLKIFVRDESLVRFIPKDRLFGPLVGSGLGFVFPVCECGNIPVARSLMIKGLPPHVVISFLLAAPVFNPIVILATLAAFPGQPEVLYMRLGFSLLIAMTVGLLFSFARNPHEYLRHSIACHLDGSQKMSTPSLPRQKWIHFFNSVVHEFFEMTGVLVIGGLIASFSQIAFPRHLITEIGTGPISSVSAMMLLATVVSICSNVDAFFALSYTSQFTMPSILAFLVFGPMIDLKALVMLNTIFRWKAIVWIALLTFQMTFLITVFMNLNIS